MRVNKSDRDEALARLRAWLKPGDTVYTVLRNVSRSGMQREISMYAMLRDDATGEVRPQWLDGSARHVLGLRVGKRDGLIVGGCGMDMGFHLVYELSARLFGQDGWECAGEKCPSNDHSNARGRKMCPQCEGGKRKLANDKVTGEGECTECYGNGTVRDDLRGPGVMHKDGGYALKAVWL